MTKYQQLREHLIWARDEMGCTPLAMLACMGGDDEHWQIWSSKELAKHELAHSTKPIFPVFVIDGETMDILPHPDGSASK